MTFVTDAHYVEFCGGKFCQFIVSKAVRDGEFRATGCGIKDSYEHSADSTTLGGSNAALYRSRWANGIMLKSA